MIEAVLFDWGDTLMETQALWGRADEHGSEGRPTFQASNPMDALEIVRRLNRES